LAKGSYQEFKEISPSEFFYRNRELAGFSNPSRSLYSAVRELVENALDACELNAILPSVKVSLVAAEAERLDPRLYTLTVEDNGPGIRSDELPNAFGKVFYGSKFVLRQSRGLFGLGGTMAILYAQITSNVPAVISSSTDGVRGVTVKLLIDVERNLPIIVERQDFDAGGWRGLRLSITLLGDYARAQQKLLDYIRQTAMAAPYAELVYEDPLGKAYSFARLTESMPAPPKEILPHPHGLDVETIRRLIRKEAERTLVELLTRNLHRVGEKTARAFLSSYGFEPERKAGELSNDEVVRLFKALQSYEGFVRPDASCLSPLGEELLLLGVKRELKPEFAVASSRPPASYSGHPFIVEVAVAYGGELPPGLRLYRFANRIPLLYDEMSDVSWKVLNEGINWARYRLSPDMPLAVVTHICSTKVPYKTVGKEYIADQPEVERELTNAIRECLRKLSLYLSRKGSLEQRLRRFELYRRYLPLLAEFSRGLARRQRAPSYRPLLERLYREGGLAGADVDENKEGEGP
jgi:DNA topoisomerase-6 subunit B